MSSGDHNCLLSVLWGNGSAKVINDLRDNTSIVGYSNEFIKEMKNSDSWNAIAEDVNVQVVEQLSLDLDYAHLAASPREIAESYPFNWKSGVALISLDDIPPVYVDEGKKIYDSVRRSPFRDKIFAMLRKNQELEKNSGSIKLVFQQEQEQPKVNVGPVSAMENIFQIKDRTDVAAGNMPFICKNNSKEKYKRFRPVLEKDVLEALARQRDLLECLELDDERRNLLPYMKNVLVTDWYSILETHLLRIHCSVYRRRQILALERLPCYSMDGQNMEELMYKLFRYKPDEDKLKKNEQKSVEKAREENREERQWWHMWLNSYHEELKVNEESGEEYQDIRTEIIHQKYDTLRKRQRERPPTKWLIKNRLLQCP